MSEPRRLRKLSSKQTVLLFGRALTPSDSFMTNIESNPVGFKEIGQSVLRMRAKLHSPHGFVCIKTQNWERGGYTKLASINHVLGLD